MNAYRFQNPKQLCGFKLVVFARTYSRARAYVHSQHNSLAHRALRYQGKGQPANPEGWVAANAG